MNLLTKNSNTTNTNDRVTIETVSVQLPGLSAGILPSALEQYLLLFIAGRVHAHVGK